MTKPADKKPLTMAQIQEIMEVYIEAAERAGRHVKTGTLIDSIDEEGNIEGEVLYDAREKKDLN